MKVSELKIIVVCLLLVTATKSVSSVDSRCFEKICFFSNWKTYTPESLNEAQKICSMEKNDSWVLEIYDRSVYDMAMNFFGDHKAEVGSKQILMGLERHDQNWTWGDGTAYKGELSNTSLKLRIETSSAPFATLRNLPFSIVTIPDSMGTNYRLRSYICSFNRLCTNETKAVQMAGKCYSIIEGTDDDKKTWFQAQEICTGLGGTLAVMSKISEDEIRKTFIPITRPQENYWIDLSSSDWSWAHAQERLSKIVMWYDGYPLHNLLKRPGNEVFTLFDYKDGGIWLDTGKPFEPLIIVCMNSTMPGKASQPSYRYGIVLSAMVILFKAINE